MIGPLTQARQLVKRYWTDLVQYRLRTRSFKFEDIGQQN